MLENLAIGEHGRQAQSSLVANRLAGLAVEGWGMPRPRQNRPARPPRQLQLGPWLDRLGRKQVEAAKAAGVTAGYISDLVSGKKPNPSPGVLLDISEWLGLTVNDLYVMPPPENAVAAAGQMPPSQMAALGRLLQDYKPVRRR